MNIFVPLLLLSTNLLAKENSVDELSVVICILICIIFILFLISIRFKLQFKKNWKELSQLLSLFDQNVNAVVVNFDGYIVYASRAYSEISGYSAKELIGSKFLKYIHADDKEKILEFITDAILQGKNYKKEFQNIKKDGTLYWVEAMFGVEQIEIDIVGYNVIMNDITVKKEFQSLSQNLEKIVDKRTYELLEKKNEIEYILDTTMEGVVILDNFICVNANESAIKIGGYDSKDDIVGHHIIEFIHDEYKELVQMKMMQRQTDPWEIIGLKKDRTTFPCLVRGTTFHNNEKELRVVSFIDLSDIKVKENQLLLAQAELQEQAHKDYLTGLYNRRYFAEISQDYMNLFQRENKEASVMMIDIDLFKNINDTYGHAEGDKVIKTLIDAIVFNTRQSDVLARFGGEEFVALLPNINAKGALHVADKLRNYVEELDVFTDDGQLIKFTISIGVSAIQADDTTIEKAIKRADDALYMAKNSGRNRVEIA